MAKKRFNSLFKLLGPGLLIAATGVGAGDLATASIAGSHLGLAVLWAAALGAFFKFVLNEGLTRWQLATGQTLLEGVATRLGRPVLWLFLPYFLFWSFVVARAMMSATGAATAAMFPIFDSVTWGVIASIVGVLIVRKGGFKLFENIMGACVAVMFVSVLLTAVLVKPDWSHLVQGLFVPKIPRQPDAVTWTVALMGGVGGTVTVLAYGYWIREAGRTNPSDLKTCRIDLGVGYLFTAMFGIAMVMIGSRIHVDDKLRPASLVISLANQLGEQLGPVGRWTFLIGAWGAVFTSLLGVWQSVPYIFADMMGILRRESEGASVAVNPRSFAYQGYLAAIAFLPMLSLNTDFTKIQKVYSIAGAWFMPMLAVTLLLLNSRQRWIGRDLRNKPMTTLVLVAVLAFFAWTAWAQIGGD